MGSSPDLKAQHGVILTGEALEEALEVMRNMAAHVNQLRREQAEGFFT